MMMLQAAQYSQTTNHQRLTWLSEVRIAAFCRINHEGNHSCSLVLYNNATDTDDDGEIQRLYYFLLIGGKKRESSFYFFQNCLSPREQQDVIQL